MRSSVHPTSATETAFVMPSVDQRRLISAMRLSGPATSPMTSVKTTLTIVWGSVATAQMAMIAAAVRAPKTKGTSPVSA